MGKILNAIANDAGFLNGGAAAPGAEYRAASNALAAMQDRLLKGLTEQQKELFFEIDCAYGKAASISVDKAFVSGIRLGARIILEIFEQEAALPAAE